MAVAHERDIVVNGVRIHVVEEGAGGEPIVFSHGMLRTNRMYDAQAVALSDRYRCIRYDHRGQGESESPRDAVIALETVYDDAVALIETLGVAPCHWVGLSMGGMVGMRLAARRPELVRSVVLLETTAERDHPTAAIQGRLSLAVLRILGARLGAKALVGPTVRLFYSPTFRHNRARTAEVAAERASIERIIRTTSPAVVRGVLARPPVVDELPNIHVPALVVVGAEDAATPPKMARRLADAIPGARFEIVAGAGHTSTVEQPDAVTALISEFLATLAS
ncbi:MAG: alpha/beta fold hydrolase [Solirubrobacteraceae bacterium]